MQKLCFVRMAHSAVKNRGHRVKCMDSAISLWVYCETSYFCSLSPCKIWGKEKGMSEGKRSIVSIEKTGLLATCQGCEIQTSRYVIYFFVWELHWLLTHHIVLQWGGLQWFTCGLVSDVPSPCTGNRSWNFPSLQMWHWAARFLNGAAFFTFVSFFCRFRVNILLTKTGAGTHENKWMGTWPVHKTNCRDKNAQQKISSIHSVEAGF